MEKDELLEQEQENQIPGTENESIEPEQSKADMAEPEKEDTGIEAETGTAESGEEAATEDTPVEEEVVDDVAETEEPAAEEPVEEAEKMLTQSQVNELVGKARAEGRASAMKELYERYGVNDDNEMNDVFGKGQGYDILNDEYTTLNGKYGDVAAENALLKSGVVANRWNDVKAILGANGMDITVENIEAEMATHPEWRNSAAAQSAEGAEAKELTPEMAEGFAEGIKPAKVAPAQTSAIRKFGSNAPETKVDTEENDALKMFGLK